VCGRGRVASAVLLKTQRHIRSDGLCTFSSLNILDSARDSGDNRNMNELNAFATAREQLTAFREGRVTAAALLEAAVARHEALKGSVNAVAVCDLDRARKDAAACDAARAKGEAIGPLAGLPMTVKECFDMAGSPATAGDPSLLARDRGCADADMVTLLRKAGAIVWGKTNVPFMLADTQCFNSIWGVTNNPYDISRTTGGSSGGSAAALATGITALEVGSDIGGSLRTPAGFCGVTSIKPTWDVLSQRGHVPGGPGKTDLNVVGPMARNIGDLRLLWRVLSGSVIVDGDSANDTGYPGEAALSSYRVAVWTEENGWPLSAAVAETIREAGRALEADVSTVSVAKPDIDMALMVDTYFRLLCGIMRYGLPPLLRRVLRAVKGCASLINRRSKVLFSQSRCAAYLASSEEELEDARRIRDRMKERSTAFFEQYDVLLMPVSPSTAFPHAHGKNQFARPYFVDGRRVPYFSWLYWISFATLLHHPAVVIRVGTCSGGLPIGVQIVGRHGSEEKLLDIAQRLETLCGGFAAPEMGSLIQ
jgi:amidase